MSIFTHLSEVPTDAIFGLNAAFVADKRADKVNLGIGIYQNEEGQIPILQAVKEAETFLVKNEKSKSYLPIAGDENYLHHVGVLTFGNTFWEKFSSKIATMQSIGGTGALRIGGELLQESGAKKIWIPNLSWLNHKEVFLSCNLQVETYPYYDKKYHKVAFEEFCSLLHTLPSRSVILLHAICHNPTGADFTNEEWKILSDIFASKNHIPFFDSAYQGFGFGVEEDVFAIRLFAEKGLEMLVACSYSKNFGLYAERIGALFVRANSEQSKNTVMSVLRKKIRQSYSNPPSHGMSVVLEILRQPILKDLWEKEIMQMRKRISALREKFLLALAAKSQLDFTFLKDRRGMFCYAELSKKQVDRLIEKHGIYMTNDGRINLTGFNQNNFERVVDLLAKEVKDAQG
ncbi:MAG: aspartate/tyrosine/aromatic aminotransferase [Chlamydiae bacterium]|nr:aspartate/tyrosine/aromatic aminotransferase [Chlamydiota bacterium]